MEYACMYMVCMCICLRMFVYVIVYVYVWACLCECLYMYVYRCVYLWMFMYVCMFQYVYMFMYICMFGHIYICECVSCLCMWACLCECRCVETTFLLAWDGSLGRCCSFSCLYFPSCWECWDYRRTVLQFGDPNSSPHVCVVDFIHRAISPALLFLIGT